MLPLDDFSLILLIFIFLLRTKIIRDADFEGKLIIVVVFYLLILYFSIISILVLSVNKIKSKYFKYVTCTWFR